MICTRAGNLPIAIKWIVGQMALTLQSVDTIIQRFNHDSSDVLQYCFDTCIPMLSTKAWRILRIMPAFVTSASLESIEQVSRLTNDVLDEAIEQLHTAYLLNDLPNKRFSVLPATRLEILRHWNSEIEKDIKLSLVDYYLRFLKRSLDTKQFQIIEEEHHNIRSLISWCDQKRYWKEVVQLAHELSKYLEQEGHYTEIAQLSLVGRYAAIEIGDRDSEFVFWKNEGSACKYIEEYSRSLACFNACLNYFRDTGDRFHYALMVMQLGILSEHQALYSDKIEDRSREWYLLLDNAKQNYLESLELFHSLNDLKREAVLLHLLGRIQHHQGKLEDAEQFFRDSLKIKIKLNDPEAAITEYQLARLLQQKGQLQEAEDLFIKSLATLTKLGRAKDIANAKWYYSLLKADLKEYETALSLVSAQRQLELPIVLPQIKIW